MINTIVYSIIWRKVISICTAKKSKIQWEVSWCFKKEINMILKRYRFSWIWCFFSIIIKIRFFHWNNFLFIFLKDFQTEIYFKYQLSIWKNRQWRLEISLEKVIILIIDLIYNIEIFRKTKNFYQRLRDFLSDKV